MSTALGISAVTAVLENLLNSVYAGAGLGSVKVSAVAPDIVQTSLGSGTSAVLQVNLFLHQVTPNAAWRNLDLPSLGADGSTRLKNQPLALDLHYLLTAYASSDCEAEALLGFAVQFLHENPILARHDVQANLASFTANPSLAALLSASGLESQIEMIKITPAVLGREEMAWLWTALKADYRLTYPFQVSVVLIQARNPTVSAVPVLQRTVAAQPNLLSPLPTLMQVSPPNSQPAASPGDLVTVTGINLAGASQVVLANSLRGVNQTIAPTNVGAGSFQFTVPNPPLQPNPPDLPAGIYLLSARVATATDVLTTNSLPFAVAPTITTPPVSPITRDAQGDATVNITCAPFLRPGQDASLLIGGQSAAAAVFTAATNSPSFAFRPLQPASKPVLVRLRVDGVDSPVIDMTKTPPVFSGPTVLVN